MAVWLQRKTGHLRTFVADSDKRKKDLKEVDRIRLIKVYSILSWSRLNQLMVSVFIILLDNKSSDDEKQFVRKRKRPVESDKRFGKVPESTNEETTEETSSSDKVKCERKVEFSSSDSEGKNIIYLQTYLESI